MAAPKSVLIINPNSTSSMTDGLKPLVESLHYKDSKYAFFTSPTGPKSINNESDAALSAEHCLAALGNVIGQHDAFLVACYSQHPLVPLLKKRDDVESKPVLGIFEASVAASLLLLAPGERFGIVSTGKVWEEILTDGVKALLGTESERSSRFAGVETTGLSATELHDAPADEVRIKMKEATKRLLRLGHVTAVCLGCAGMAGMNEMVREAAVEELGQEKGAKVRIVDGVQAGTASLEGLLRMGL